REVWREAWLNSMDTWHVFLDVLFIRPNRSPVKGKRCAGSQIPARRQNFQITPSKGTRVIRPWIGTMSWIWVPIVFIVSTPGTGKRGFTAFPSIEAARQPRHTSLLVLTAASCRACILTLANVDRATYSGSGLD